MAAKLVGRCPAERCEHACIGRCMQAVCASCLTSVVNAGVCRRTGKCSVVGRRRGGQGDRAAEGHRRRLANDRPPDRVVLRAVRLGGARDGGTVGRGGRQLPAMAAAAAARGRGGLGR